MVFKKNKKEYDSKIPKSAIAKSESRTFYCIMAPFLLLFFVYRLFPMVWGLYISFTNYSGFNLDSMKVVGFKNYIRVFSDNEAMSSLGRTFLIGVIVIPLSIIICNTLATLLMFTKKGVGIYRTLFYIPSIIPVVAVGTMWRGMFLRDGGVFNEIIKLFNGQPVNWMGFDYAGVSLMIMLLWGAGSGLLNNIAAIKNIPKELFEAARLDGANVWHQITRIILPLSSPMNYMALVTGIITSLQLYGQPMTLSGIGMSSVPVKPLYTYMVHAYQQIFVNLRFGYGMALTVVVVVIMVVLTMLNERFSKKWVHID